MPDLRRRALFCSSFALAAALGAGLGEHHEAARGRDLARAVAGAAGLALGPRLGARAGALLAGGRRPQEDLALAAEHGLLEREPLLHPDVLAARRAATAAGSAAEELGEDVLEVREDVRALEAGGALEAGVPELVVPSALLPVREDLIGLGRLLEASLGRGVSGVAIRMELQGRLAVGLADVVGGGVARNAEDFVVVALFTHGRTVRGGLSRRAAGMEPRRP